MLGLGNNLTRFRKFGGAISYLLDTYTGAATAYSLRKLSSTTTNVVRVRRSSDNAEQDFTANQITDGSLTSFCGAGNGFVTTWYDQSGNGHNLTQVLASNQPLIVNLGSLILRNGKASVLFDNLLKDLVTTTPTLAEPSSLFTVNNIDNPISTTTNNFVRSATGSLAYLGKISSTDTIIAFNGSILDSATIPTSNQTVYSFLCNNTTSNIYINNELKARGISGNRDFIGLSINIGDGTMQELIAYPTNQDANRLAITTEINNHYNSY